MDSGDTGNAIYSAGFQIYAILLTLSSVGIPNAISQIVSRKVAVDDENGAYRILKIAIVLFSIIGFGCTIILKMCSKQIANDVVEISDCKTIMEILSPSIFLVSIVATMRGYFNGIGRIDITAKSQNIEQIIKTILTIVLVEIVAKLTNNNTVSMAETAALATTLSTLCSVMYIYYSFKKNKKNIWKKTKFSAKRKEKLLSIIKEVLTVTIPISICAFLGVAIKSIDSITIVKNLKNSIGENEAKKLYGILSGKVDMIVNLPLALNTALSTTLIPTISRLMAQKNISEFKKRIKQSLKISGIIGIISTLGIFLFSNVVIKILFPNAIDGSMMLKISSIGITFSILIQTINGILQGIGKTNVCIYAMLIGVAVKLVLNIILLKIEVLGIYGAIVSTIISYIITLLLSFGYLKVNKFTNLVNNNYKKI